MSGSEVKFGSLGETRQILASVVDKDGKPVIAAVSWHSEKPEIASVSADGTITALANGSTRVVAMTGSISAGLPVDVTQKLTKLAIGPGASSLPALGATITLTASAQDSRGNVISGVIPVWSSQDPSVASVSSTGVVTAIGNGSTAIHAKVDTLIASASFEVRQVASSIEIAPGSVELVSQGETVRLAATVFDSRKNSIADAPTNWISSDPGTASVDQFGRVTALVSNGVASISARSGNAVAEVPFSVLAPSDYRVQFLYVSPSRSSSPADQAAYISVLTKLATDVAIPGLSTSDRSAYVAELALYESGVRTFAYHEPADGTPFPGTSQASFQDRTSKVRALADRVRGFYRHHTGRQFRMEPLKAVRLEESALHYWTPVIYPGSVDRNPIVNKISDELIRRGLVNPDYRSGKTIHVLIMDGGGGWAGAYQWGANTGRDPFGGLAGTGDMSACLDTPQNPGTERAIDRGRWPGHLQSSWATCTYNLVFGTVVHELGHSFGLPHPSDFQCAGLAGDLVMQSHWNADITSANYFRTVFGAPSTNSGILKEWSLSACQPTNPNVGYGAGIGTSAMPNAKFRTELEILLNNPHFK